jgi:hypothetical protein
MTKKSTSSPNGLKGDVDFVLWLLALLTDLEDRWPRRDIRPYAEQLVALRLREPNIRKFDKRLAEMWRNLKELRRPPHHIGRLIRRMLQEDNREQQ